MKIGIKYCGGCRTEYDRKEIVYKLISEHEISCFEEAKENIAYDVLLVVNGCKTACSDHHKYNCKRRILINSKQDYLKTRNKMLMSKDICRKE